MGRKKKAVSVYSLAKEFGCTPSTISKAFSNSVEISDSLRGRILERADELNFRPNTTRRRATNVCVLMHMEKDREIGFHGYVEPVFQGIFRFCREKGLEFSLFAETGSGLMEVNLARELRQRNADCAVVIGAPNSSGFFRDLDAANFVYRCVYDGPPERTVRVDNRRAGQLAVEHLFELGHRRIAIARQGSDRNASMERFLGFTEAMTAAGISFPPEFELTPPADATGESWGRKILRDWQQAGKPFSALFTLGENVALSLLSEAVLMGIRIPDELSIISCDNLPISELSGPPLTVIQIPNRRSGYLATQQAWEHLQSGEPPPSNKPLEVTDVVQRHTTAAPR